MHSVESLFSKQRVHLRGDLQLNLRGVKHVVQRKRAE